MRVTMDYETRSFANIKKVGTYGYATHPTTEILCLAWQYDAGNVELWHPAFPGARLRKRKRAEGEWPAAMLRYANGMPEEGRLELEELFYLIESGAVEEIEAHNAMFERVITEFVAPRYGFPKFPTARWRCSASKAATFAIPRDLEGGAMALGLREQKDKEGHALMLKLSQPARDSVKNPDRVWYEDVEDFQRLFEYCRQDVRTEHELSTNLRPLPPIELATWQLDQEMNLRGVMVDVPFVRRALELAEAEIEVCNQEISRLTVGEVGACSQVGNLLGWLQSEGWPGDNLQAETIDASLAAGGLPAHVARALELRRSAARTSTKKYQAINVSTAIDDRIRDLLAYHGANTGRWAGRRVQPQNFPRGTISGNIETLVADIMRFGNEDLRLIYGDPMELLATALRGVFIAPPGKHLFVADYAAIEARVTFWIAGQLDMLEVLASGKDIYKVQASSIFGLPIERISKDQRQLGKAAVLGLGFQMGGGKFVESAAGYGVTIPVSCGHKDNCDCVTGMKTVKAYRTANDKVVQLWADLQDGAIEAISRGHGGDPVVTGKITWAQRGRFLHAKLPSGRLLSYCDPWVESKRVTGERADGTTYDFWAPSIRFMGFNSQTRQWGREYTYGGSLTENVVQATARDLMRDAMHRVEATGVYKMVLTIHDELVAEADEDKGDLHEYEQLVSAIEPWAAGMPVKAEGWRGPRYHK